MNLLPKYKLPYLLTLDNIMCSMLTIYITFNIFFSFSTNPLSTLLIGISTFTAIKFIFNKIDDTNLSNYGNFDTHEYLIYLIMILFACSISILWNYPATMRSDALYQFWQATTNHYSDIHPIFHTIIFFKLPTLIWQSYTSCAIFQCLFITLILLYFSCFCRKYFLSKTQTVAFLTFILINPTFLKMATMPLKDIPFSYCLMLGTLFLIEIFISNGNWLIKNKNRFLFCLVCFGIVFFRHNGIANFILMAIPLSIFYKTSRRFLIILCAVLTFSKLTSNHIYNILGVKKMWTSSDIRGVTLNHPIKQMSFIYNNGGDVSEHDSKIMNSINHLDNWKKYQDTYDLKKEKNGYDKTFVADNYGVIIKTWLHMAYNNPTLAAKNYLYTVSPIWGITKGINFTHFKHLRIKYSGPKRIRAFMEKYVIWLEKTHMKFILLDIGESLVVIMLSFCLTIRKMKHNYKIFVPYILVFSNIAVIMCTISELDRRFVYSSILCSYPLILFALHNNRTKEIGNS